MKNADNLDDMDQLRVPGRCLTDIDTEDLDAGLEKYGGSENLQTRIDFCLRYLDEIKSGKTGDPGEPRQLARAALAGRYLSFDLVRAQGLDPALEQLSKALDDARASNYHDVQYYCLKQMGTLYSWKGDNETAVLYFQQSLLYSWTFWPLQFLASLQLMAFAWSNPQTLDKAVMAFDWMLLIEPKNFATMRDKFEALAANGKIENVSYVASAGPGATCESHANCASSLYALKRYDEAYNIAQAGLQLSQQVGDARSESQFTTFIEMLDQKQATKNRPS